MEPIYLDYNATTPLHPRVAEVIRDLLDGPFGNPSSSHSFGRDAKEVVESARSQVAALIGATAEEIVFTSGGTEANNHAIRGIARARRSLGNHIITSSVEHPAVTKVCDWLEAQGFWTSRLPVDRSGRVDPAHVAEAITGETVLVTIMHANNEVGTIQPISEIAEICAKHNVPLHTDAAQSLGKAPAAVDDLGVDLLSIAGHKLYGPKGVGALYVRAGTVIEPLMQGAGHESGRRPGTENILLAAGLGAACERAVAELPDRIAHMRGTRDRLHAGLAERCPGLIRHGDPEHCLPNTLSVAFPGIVAVDLLESLPGIAASAGAACHSDVVQLSATLAAMGLSQREGVGTVRFSTGRNLTTEEVDRTVEVVAAAVNSSL